MKIGVISDTHSLAIPKQVMDELKKVDLIIHAGDFCCHSDYEPLRKLKEVKAVQGNMDGPDIRKLFPVKQTFVCDGVKIGLYHGEGAAPAVLERVKKEFVKDDVQVVVFGHSHQPLNEMVGKTLYFNPGSPNDMVRAPYCSFGILEISQGKVVGRIIKVK